MLLPSVEMSRWKTEEAWVAVDAVEEWVPDTDGVGVLDYVVVGD